MSVRLGNESQKETEPIQLDLRDAAIIEQLPKFVNSPEILTVGCGKCRLERGLVALDDGWHILATDIELDNEILKYGSDNLKFQKFDLMQDKMDRIFEVVICSQVLEHLVLWRKAFDTLVNLTANKLIVTVPYGRSFMSPDHRNFWFLNPKKGEESLTTFGSIAYPYSTSIAPILTKPEDRDLGNRGLIITVDKKNQGAL